MADQKPALDVLTITPEDAEAFFGPREKEHERLISPFLSELRQSSVVFDIGANAGYFSRSLVSAGFMGTLVLFEPIPNLLSIAIKTLDGCLNTKVFVNAAVGDVTTSIDIFLPENNNIGWVTAVKEKVTTEAKIRVPVVNAENFIDIYHPDIIKIDVEGFESFILSACAKKISDNYQPIFLVELGWGTANPHWSKFISTAEKFITAGYQFHAISKERKILSVDELRLLDKTTDVVIAPKGKL